MQASIELLSWLMMMTMTIDEVHYYILDCYSNIIIFFGGFCSVIVVVIVVVIFVTPRLFLFSVGRSQSHQLPLLPRHVHHGYTRC